MTLRYMMLILLSVFGLTGCSGVVDSHGDISIEAVNRIIEEEAYIENEDYEFIYEDDAIIGIEFYELYGDNEYDIDFRNEISAEGVDRQVLKFNAATTNLDVSFIVVGAIAILLVGLIVMRIRQMIKK